MWWLGVIGFLTYICLTHLDHFKQNREKSFRYKVATHVFTSLNDKYTPIFKHLDSAPNLTLDTVTKEYDDIVREARIADFISFGDDIPLPIDKLEKPAMRAVHKQSLKEFPEYTEQKSKLED